MCVHSRPQNPAPVRCGAQLKLTLCGAGTEKKSWNKTWPVFRICARTEYCRRQGADAVGAERDWEHLELGPPG